MGETTFTLECENSRLKVEKTSISKELSALYKEGNSSNTIQSETTLSQEDLNPNDIPSTGLNIVSFLIPLVGLIIYLTEKDKAPKKANAAGKAAIWGTGIAFVLGVIAFTVLQERLDEVMREI